MSEVVVSGAEPILQSKVRGFSPNITLDQFLVSSDFLETDKSAKTKPQDLVLMREQFLSLFGVEAQGNEQIARVLERIVEERIKNIFGPIQDYIPLIYAALLFVSLRFVIPLVVWVSSFAGSLGFRLLAKFNFVRMSEKSITVESPELT